MQATSNTFATGTLRIRLLFRGEDMKERYADLLAAISFAAAKHSKQRRKDVDASPYINHPPQVAPLLATQGAVSDVETLMAAVLHDTIEDTKTNYDELVQ